MQEMPNDILTLFALALAFGIKHGLDPDHLATIDGLARFNASSKPWLAKWAGVLFSIGHGIVVTAVVATVAFLPAKITVPGWLEGFGSAVSILTLLVLGVLNLHAAFNRTHALTRPVGLKGWMRIQSGHPAIVLGIGALFALSFDTISQAAFFSLAATHLSGKLYAIASGMIFTCGMIISDGLNGIVTSRLIKQSALRARIASRIMSFAIGSVSLALALTGLARVFIPNLSDIYNRFGIWPSMVVLAWVVTGFFLALHFARLTKTVNKNAV